MEYVYALKNNSYEPYVVKIGKTTVEPYIRSRQIYWGATGVPEHFDVAFVCAVPDCGIAESNIQKVLDSYRKNKRREFFHLPIDTAKRIITFTCEKIFGANKIKIVIDENTLNEKIEKDIVQQEKFYSNEETISVSLDKLMPSPINTSTLTDEQKHRIVVINSIFSEVFPIDIIDTIDDFSRDHNPDREIEIWEHMAKAFMKVSTQPFITDEFKREAFHLLLSRSWKSTTNVLKGRTSNVINEKHAKLLLKAYELKPKPITIFIGKPPKNRI